MAERAYSHHRPIDADFYRAIRIALGDKKLTGVRHDLTGDRGMIVKAYVVLRAGVTGDAALTKALQEHVRSTVAPYKYPRAIEYVEALPKTPTGKLQRFELRHMAATTTGRKMAS